VAGQDGVRQVIAEEKERSVAMGKKGQKVRLAAKLTGWRIDIKSEEEKRREVEAQFEGLELGTPAEAGPSTDGTAVEADAAAEPDAVASEESADTPLRSEEHTAELQPPDHRVCRTL